MCFALNINLLLLSINLWPQSFPLPTKPLRIHTPVSTLFGWNSPMWIGFIGWAYYSILCVCVEDRVEDRCPTVKMALDFTETKNVQIGTWFIVIWLILHTNVKKINKFKQKVCRIWPNVRSVQCNSSELLSYLVQNLHLYKFTSGTFWYVACMLTL